MKEVFPYLYKTDYELPFSLGSLKSSAYLLIRPGGNVLIYGSKKIGQYFDLVSSIGGVYKQLLSHRDEASNTCDDIQQHYHAPVLCSESDREVATCYCANVETFSGDCQLEDDLSVIETPESACFYWRAPGKNILFVGDTLKPDQKGNWVTMIKDKSYANIQQVIESLNKLRNLEVDMIIPARTESNQFYQQVTRRDWQRIIDAAVGQLMQVKVSSPATA